MEAVKTQKAKKKPKSTKTKAKPVTKKKKKLGLCKAVEALLVKKPKATYEETLKLARSIKKDTKFNETHFAFYKFRAKKIRDSSR